MSDPLATYLHDHLAGSHFAIKLLESMREQYKEESLGVFAQALVKDIRQDQDTLKKMIESVGKVHLDLTEAAGWIAERASQFKLRRDEAGGGIGTFEALEALTLGIKGKLALWLVLPVIRKVDSRVPDEDFEQLAARAEEQYARVEKLRLQQAIATFAPAKAS